jgi:hypothetical protein
MVRTTKRGGTGILTAEDFRRIALGMEGAIEGAHMGHADFRVDGKIFATLHADLEWGMVKLTPAQQDEFVRQYPAAFAPENGAWGRQGCTAVRLAVVDEDAVGEAMTLAWRNGTAGRATGRPKAKAKTRVSRTSTRVRRSSKR